MSNRTLHFQEKLTFYSITEFLILLQLYFLEGDIPESTSLQVQLAYLDTSYSFVSVQRMEQANH